ncbi:MAG: hypothetical protein A2X03_00955 [Bacteroidetes bacterium GWA2_40_15]|nr:MAG: hypothetical protein A2X03_00955 [Bacteroidetes bacterium GWA2_40_15]OFX96785.1 MAG: hypothetical protein A2X06_11635 [Bacteroidetes bacterium GWC2_40_22]HAM10646.1 hypothetical protein [Bacteroidales bacterium]HBH85300.1 hypothetical protein [Bacteroidales bacterium]
MNIKKSFLLGCVIIFSCTPGLTQLPVTFENRIIDHEPPDNIWIKSTGDYNGDGHHDLLIAGHNGKSQDFIIWYQNPGVTDGNWIKHTVYQGGEAYGFEGGASGDLDGDGDVDLVTGSYWQDKLFWLENPGKGIGKWELHELGYPKSGTTYLYDFNSDGKLDIITRASEKYSGDVGRDIWIWKQNTPESWTKYRKLIGDGEYFNIGDVDNDGNTDVVFANKWLRNNGNIDISKWEEYTFTNAYTWLSTFPVIIDMNKDGRNDIVLTPTVWAGEYHKTAWYEAPENPVGNLWNENIIEDNIECVTHALGVYDFNLDGYPDVFTAEMHQGEEPHEVRIYYNSDLKGNSWKKQVISERGSHSNQFIDFDGDGDIDIFGSNHGGKEKPKVEIWINTSNQKRKIAYCSSGFFYTVRPLSEFKKQLCIMK